MVFVGDQLWIFIATSLLPAPSFCGVTHLYRYFLGQQFITPFTTSSLGKTKNHHTINKYNYERINRKGTVVDVSSPQEFEGEHFPGAINIPLEQVSQKANELKQMPKPIIAY